jgi:cell division protein FtsB
MTAKRFEIKNNMNLDSNYVETYELSCIVDNENKTFYFIVDSIANVESFVERLNELHEENKKLRMSPRVESIELEALICENQQLKQENKQLRHQIETYKSGNALLKKTLDKEWK